MRVLGAKEAIMDIWIFSVLSLAVLLLALVIRHFTFQPERVFTDKGESVLLCKKTQQSQQQ